MLTRFVAIAFAALSLGLASLSGPAALAQSAPAPSPTPIVLPTVPPSTTLDPYVRTAIDILTGAVNRTIANFGNSSTGQVTYFKRFEMQIQTGNNAYRSIHLHQGTVINPTGKSIQVGQTVQVSGQQQADGSLNANVITINQ